MVIAPTAREIHKLARAGSAAGPVKHPLIPRRSITGGVLWLFVIAVLANLALLAGFFLAKDQTPTPPVNATHPAPPPPAASHASQPVTPAVASGFGEGMFSVGTDIAPGTYRTSGPAGRLDCYWERLKDTRGGTDSIIANYLGRGSSTVTIDKSDAAFQTRWCNPWVKIN